DRLAVARGAHPAREPLDVHHVVRRIEVEPAARPRPERPGADREAHDCGFAVDVTVAPSWTAAVGDAPGSMPSVFPTAASRNRAGCGASVVRPTALRPGGGRAGRSPA